MSTAMDPQKTAVPTRPQVTPLHGGGLDLEEVQAKLLAEFSKQAKSDPIKSTLPTEAELQGDFDALVEARALQLIEARSRSGSFSLSGPASPFQNQSPFQTSNSLPSHSPNQASGSPPVPTHDHSHLAEHVSRPHINHLPSGLSMTSAVPSHPSPLAMTSSAPVTDEPRHTSAGYDPNESAISSGANTPATGASLSRSGSYTGSRRGSRVPSRRPSMKANENNYEVR